MSDMSKDQLLKELAAYKRSLERERQARALAEQELESYSRRIYQSESLLQDQAQLVQNKQDHLSFLISVAEDNWLSESVEELIDRYLALSCRFLTSTTAAYFQIEADLAVTRLQVATADYFSDTTNSFDETSIAHVLKQVDLAQLKQDFIDKNKAGAFDLSEYGLKQSLWVYLLPVFHSKGSKQNKLACMCFFYQLKDNIDLLKFETIAASHSTFSVALERKKAEAAVKQKLQELQSSHTALQNMQQQLIESEKLASLGLLSAGVAHEINNPVGFVLSNLVTMEEYFSDIEYSLKPLYDNQQQAQAQVKEYLARAQKVDMGFLLKDSLSILSSSAKGLERVKDIVADLNSFARMDSDELVDIDINTPIRSALNILHNELKYDHEVALNLADDLIILGNEGQLQQVFINFFINAKQAMPDGGMLTVTTQRREQRVIVTIQDRGCGIAESDIKEIFTPFFTTKPQGEGTGLGLSISYSILQRHHAKIDVKSVVGKGTIFGLSFIAST